MMPEGQRGSLRGKRKEPEEGWSAGQEEGPNDGRRAGRSETEGKSSRRDDRRDMDWRGREGRSECRAGSIGQAAPGWEVVARAVAWIGVRGEEFPWVIR